jgi:phenylpropionate dioxygenase-like ring-hydroxylating dioxygenase large terminal subunit
MTETLTGTDRSAGVSYRALLDADTHPVSDALRKESPLAPGAVHVPVSRYTSRAFFELEVERVWKRVWQMACHEDDVPNVGDYLPYDIAGLSFLVVRTSPTEIKAYWNACLHRGRLLRESPGRGARDLRCPFHGWCWNLDGSLKEIPCEWDFPHVEKREQSLPEVKVGRWGGFVFINPDPQAAPLEEFLGDLSSHFPVLPYERRWKEAHVAKVLRCNWKVAQEAFMEAYHVVATHPQLLAGIGDSNSQYDVFGNYSRAITPNGVRSPHLAAAVEPYAEDGRMRHPLSGALYGADASGRVSVETADGRHGTFTARGEYLAGELLQADPHFCLWVAGEPPRGAKAAGLAPSDWRVLRAGMAAYQRSGYRALLGDLVERIADAELNDSIYLTLFPNFHPWGSFNKIVYRFRPNGTEHEEAIMECMFFAPAPAGQPRPPAAPIHWLGPDEDWTHAPELGMLGRVFNQDTFNLPNVQRGLHATARKEIQLARYQETKIRHFHQLLEKWVGPS